MVVETHKYIIDVRKELIASKIIFEKRLDVFDFVRDYVESNLGYEYYEKSFRKYHLDILTPQEFDLIIDVYKNYTKK